MKRCYRPHSFNPASLALIQRAASICEEYARQGFILTLRQLYYQFVARGLLANVQRNYDRLGELVSDARLAGLLDWRHLEDRTRNVRALSHWDAPGDVIASAAASYHRNLWATQPAYVEVWIEKDALVGVIAGVCARNDVPYFSCRGYTSQSEMWGASRRLLAHGEGRDTVILHLGDHDPSGLDMTRDIADRLALFCETDGGAAPTVRRLALNRDQVDAYQPPPNPAKVTDSRYTAYVAEHGAQSWELDALEPRVLEELLDDAIGDYRDQRAWDDAIEQQERERDGLRDAARAWDAVQAMLSGRHQP